MFGNGRKTIGVILCDVSSHYQEQICQTLSTYAREADYNLAYFTFYSCYGTEVTRNGRGEANIVYLIPFEKLDAIILCHDTLGNKPAMEYILESIKKSCNCPVVTLRHELDSYPSVLVDHGHCIEDLVYHFVDEHHKTKLGFMSGPLEHPDSIRRLDDFKRALANRGIPFDQKMVYEGDFWSKKAKDAANYFMMELDEPPEAIVCANDYMASSLMNVLIEKGFLVPDDIAVSGFDNIWEASITLPPITTVSVPVKDMAQKAIRLIESMWRGEEVEKRNYVKAEVILRNSCGCQTFNMQSMLAKRVRQVNEYQSFMESTQSNTYMFVDLSDLDHVDGIEKHLRIEESDHIDSFFICLGEGRGDKYPKYRSSSNGFAKKSKVVGGMFHKKSCQCNSFDTERLLPEEVSEDKPMIYFFFPLHNNQYSFGYVAISYEDNYRTNKTFNNWLAILGNALETIRIKQKNQGLLQELNNLYVHDALTGLFNRRGFDSLSQEYYDKARKEKKSFIVIAIDMDNLKVVNDRFGHMNGDLALKTIGDAMQSVSQTEDGCARVGGDEYNVIGVGYTEEMAQEFVDKFNRYLEEFNTQSGLPYLIKASVGYHILQAEEEMELEECINAADGKLYEYKRKKKEQKLDNVLRPEDDQGGSRE